MYKEFMIKWTIIIGTEKKNERKGRFPLDFDGWLQVRVMERKTVSVKR